MDADDLQPVGGVGLVELLDTGDGALAVDARVGPEVDELDLSRPVRLAQGLVAGGVEPRGGPRDGGQGAAVGQVVGARDAGPVRPRAPAVEEPVDAGLEGGGVVGQGALEGRGQVEDERHGQGDHEGPGGQAHAPLTGAEGPETLGDPLPRQREGQQGHGGAQGEGQGQGHGVRADPPGGARHGDGRQDRAGAGDVGGAQDQAQGEAAGGVARAQPLEPGEGALHDLHDPRDDHAHANEGQQDDPRPADEVLGQVEEGEQGRSQEGEDGEAEHQAGDHQVGAPPGGGLGSGVGPCRPGAPGQEDDRQDRQDTGGDPGNEASEHAYENQANHDRSLSAGGVTPGSERKGVVDWRGEGPLRGRGYSTSVTAPSRPSPRPAARREASRAAPVSPEPTAAQAASLTM